MKHKHDLPVIDDFLEAVLTLTEVNVCWILEVNVTPLVSKASYCSKDAS